MYVAYYTFYCTNRGLRAQFKDPWDDYIVIVLLLCIFYPINIYTAQNYTFYVNRTYSCVVNLILHIIEYYIT